MKEFTVFIDQRSRTNYQVKAKNEEQARDKARELYNQNFLFPYMTIEEGWMFPEDSEDKL